MRLICPNCDAQYEIDNSVIPDDGRDVQCSNCGHTWFQTAENTGDELADSSAAASVEDAEIIAQTEEPPASIPEPQSPPAPDLKRRELDDSVRDVLRAEAEREALARREEGSPLETQPDLGLDSGDAFGAQAAIRERTARLRGIEPESTSDGSATSRRDMLPDIEEINSTLRATSERKGRKEKGAPEDPETLIEQKKGFRRGFSLVIIVAGLAFGIYFYQQRIANRFPQIAPYLAQYSQKVDAMRVWLDVQMQKVVDELPKE